MKRYDFVCGGEGAVEREVADGEFAKWSDVEVLAAERDALKAEVERARQLYGHVYDLLKDFDVYGTGGDASSCAREARQQITEKQQTIDAFAADNARLRAVLASLKSDGDATWDDACELDELIDAALAVKP